MDPPAGSSKLVLGAHRKTFILPESCSRLLHVMERTSKKPLAPLQSSPHNLAALAASRWKSHWMASSLCPLGQRTQWNSEPYSCVPRLPSRSAPESAKIDSTHKIQMMPICLDWKRPQWCFDRNQHISISDGWRIFCGRCLANSFHHLFCFVSYLFPRRRYHLFFCDRVLQYFCPHVCPSLFLGFFKRLVRSGHTFCPVPLKKWCGHACFQFPCLSWCGSSCLCELKRSNLCTFSLPSQ